MELKGQIENIVFRNEDNGYTVLDVNVNGELITAVGCLSFCVAGQDCTLNGEYKLNSKFGKQFAISNFNATPPKNLEGIKKYLGSGLISGVGEVTAEKIVNTFGDDTLSVIEFAPMRLAEINGISKNKAGLIAGSFSEIKKMQEAVLFLQNFDITVNMATKIYNIYKDRTIKILKDNPYRLVEDIDGIGFLTADKIAIKMGVPKDSPFRLRAGILYGLTNSAEKNGNTFLPKDTLMQDVFELLGGFYEETFDIVIDELKLDNKIKVFFIDNFEAVMPTTFYFAELNIATKLNMLNMIDSNCLEFNEKELSLFEEMQNIEFHHDQKKAIKLAIESGVCVLTGGPGTGKTTIVKAIINLLENAKKKILLLAPTGRAAKRLSESTNKEAKTIHRGLEVMPQGIKAGFVYNESNKLPYDAIIVDEVSMIDVPLFNSLLKAVGATAKLILVGDKNQLPSVGAGNVLSDILQSEVIVHHNLTHIYRQDENSKIVTNAQLINLGQMPEINNSSIDFFFENREEPKEIAECILELISKRLPKFLKTDPKNIQVLAPLKAGLAGIDYLNEIIQNKINPARFGEVEAKLEKVTFRAGDKIMQTVNNYDQEWKKIDQFGEIAGTGVFNGDIGIVKAVITGGQELVVEFDDGRVATYARPNFNELSLAYAITIHKSQGSEFDYCIIPVVAGAPTILTKNLLYTAVTRAKKLVVLVGTKTNISRMVRNNYTAKRFSALSYLIKKKSDDVKDMFK